MKKQTNPNIKAHLLRGALYLILPLAVGAIPFTLAAVAPLFQHGETGKSTQSTHPTALSDLLQFTSCGHALGFGKNGVYVANGSHSLRVEFVNARSTNPVNAAGASDAKSDAKARPLSQISYPSLWDGVTLTYDAPKGAIARSTYRLEPHAKAENIRLRYNAPVAVQDDGSLLISFKTGAMNESAPQAWQERDGKRVPVQIAFASRGEHEVGFAVGEYDRSEPLFIDPTLTTLTWNTFLGGSNEDIGYGVAVDGSGNVYVVGYSVDTWGSPVRAFTPPDPDCAGNCPDAFAAKLDSSGNLIWNTFLGGSRSDIGYGVAVDGSGNVHVAGGSNASWGSPVRAFDCSATNCNGSDDPNAFAAKLDTNGNLIWNTFLGGISGPGDTNFGLGVAVDGRGNVYVAGDDDGPGNSNVNAFAAKLDSNGNLIWSNTSLGGPYDPNTGGGDDHGTGVAVDGRGNVYVVGYSNSTWGTPMRAFSGLIDAFAARLSSNGNLIWNTFLGGGINGQTGQNPGYGVAVDGRGNVCVAGWSDTTWGSPRRPYSGSGEDAFAAKLNSRGTLLWNTFLGGGLGTDVGYGVAVDGSGNVYVAGDSNATWGRPDRAYSGNFDVFAARLSPKGRLIWNTFLGGIPDDFGQGAIAVDESGNVYVAGESDATWGSPVREYTCCGNDAFAAKITQ